jgi:O-methyltransferase
MTINFAKSRAQMAFHVALSKLNFGLTNYRHADRADALSSVSRARSLAYTATTPLECVEIRNAVRAVSKVPGQMAEVGVYRGGTAALILDTAPQKHLHLFDTFSGLPDGGDYLKQGEYAGSKESVQRTLVAYKDRITLHAGLFPRDTGHEVEDLRFSFVHLDMDLYEGTLGALRFFWPRMNPGGILLCHDYPQIGGIVNAIHEFFAGERESFLPLSGQQCLAIKL